MLSGGLGGAHPMGPPKTIGPAMGVGRLGDQCSSIAGDEVPQYLEVRQQPINQE